jgi:citrate lyase beta subunit
MPTFGDQFRLTLITADPILAAEAGQAGVDRIGLDLECLGKAERQRGEDTRLSNHKVEDLPAIARGLVRADLFVRLNPINTNTQDEIDAVLGFGAKVLMLPFFRTEGEVSTFVLLVAKRAYVIILVETASAAGAFETSSRCRVSMRSCSASTTSAWSSACKTNSKSWHHPFSMRSRAR